MSLRYGRRKDDRKPTVLVYAPVQRLDGFADVLNQVPAVPIVVTEAEACAQRLAAAAVDLLVINAPPEPWNETRAWRSLIELGRSRRIPTVVISDRQDPATMQLAASWGAAEYLLRPHHSREAALRLRAVLFGQLRIVCLGGGTGLFTLLSGLKQHAQLLPTAIVAMSDDGGSSGRLRSELGILPPGDVRRSLVALSTAPALMNGLLQFRFSKGDALAPHNLGNLILAALTELRGGMAEAVRDLGDILAIQGIVLPVSPTATRLCARTRDGAVIQGETEIGDGTDRLTREPIASVWHEPEATASPAAVNAILTADAVVLGPGDLFTSVLANVCIPGIREALLATPAERIYVCNVMTKPGETRGYTAADHVADVVRCLGRDVLEVVLVSESPVSPRAAAAYAALGQQPVILGDPERMSRLTKARIAAGDFSHETELIRHDSDKLARAVLSVLPGSARHVLSTNTCRARST